MSELAKQYDPTSVEPQVTDRWLETRAFAAHPDERDDRYVIMMPLPNVTGALHMGHAMDNVMQDHAGALASHGRATTRFGWRAPTTPALPPRQVVEKRLFELEGKTRHDIGREGAGPAHLGVEGPVPAAHRHPAAGHGLFL